MSKISTKPKNYSFPDIYKFYAEGLISKNPTWTWKRVGAVSKGIIYDENNNVYIDYKQFKKILTSINTELGNKLIQGYKVNLENSLGTLYIARIEANPNNRRINHNETSRLRKRLEEEGDKDAKTVLVYYTDEEYIRLKHLRPNHIKNLVFYHFKPSGGPTGYRRKMSRSYNNNLKGIYPFIKYTAV